MSSQGRGRGRGRGRANQPSSVSNIPGFSAPVKNGIATNRQTLTTSSWPKPGQIDCSVASVVPIPKWGPNHDSNPIQYVYSNGHSEITTKQAIVSPVVPVQWIANNTAQRLHVNGSTQIKEGSYKMAPIAPIGTVKQGLSTNAQLHLNGLPKSNVSSSQSNSSVGSASWGLPKSHPLPYMNGTAPYFASSLKATNGQLTYTGDGTTKAIMSGTGDMMTKPIGKGKKGIVAVDHIKTRPDNLQSKKGTSGQEVRLLANYFRLNHQTTWCLYQYRVDFMPDEDRTFVRKALLKDHAATLGGYLFDGTILYSAQRLYPDMIELNSARKQDGTQIVIRLKMVGHLCMGDYQYLQFFNILIRRCFEGLKLQLVGRNFFDAISKVEIPQYHLQLWPGYITSIRQHESSILMCTEITHKVMRLDTAHHVLDKCRESRNFREDFERFMLGAVVLTDYNNKTYKIDGVNWDMSPLSTFKKKTGEEISFLNYYKTKYNVIIKDTRQPMLIHRSKDKDIRSGCPAYQALVPELCRTTGLTDDMRSNFQLMRAMSEHTRVNPEMRIRKLMDFNLRLRTTPETQKELSSWQMDLDEKLLEFTGRVLTREKINLGSRKVDVDANVDWTRDLRSSAMLSIVNINRWHILFLPKFRKDSMDFLKILQKAAASMKLTISQPVLTEVPDDKSSTYTDILERVLSSSATPDLVLCVVPNNRSDRYSAIKKKVCVDRMVPTQVILAKNLVSKGVMSIATKVAIQMNCKMGGAPWSVEIPITTPGLMVIGFDVCHDSSNKSLSYGALVASIDRCLTRYFSAVSHHARGEELANDLVVNISKALLKYKQYNGGTLPQRIVFYRDGVGDGQIPYVHNQEVKLVVNLLKEQYGDLPVRLAYIIVSKRINTRIFSIDRKNPVPGTVVDDVITLPERYDFFLVSQTVRQGTVSPTSYNVIYDTLGLDPDKIQRLSYKLTHMYYNWSGTCRVPAPCQYAHKLAYLVGQSLHRTPNNGLDDSLYFL